MTEQMLLPRKAAIRYALGILWLAVWNPWVGIKVRHD